VARLVLFNKPFQVLSQFRASGDKETLAAHIRDPDLRVAGRLDYDSEGLLLLTDDGALVQRITHPRSKMPKTYWAQVEGLPDEQALDILRQGVTLKDGPTRPAQVRRLPEPETLWPRDPPIRHRVSVPDCWLEITIREGRNRQVRRMTAAIGHPTLRLVRVRVGAWGLEGRHPTLRLVRVRVGAWGLEGLAPGEQREITV
jgi:23S rRNA pseudouridine2457 synthase